MIPGKDVCPVNASRFVLHLLHVGFFGPCAWLLNYLLYGQFFNESLNPEALVIAT